MYSVGGIAGLESTEPLPFPLYDSRIDQVFFFASAHIPGVPQFRSNPHAMQIAQAQASPYNLIQNAQKQPSWHSLTHAVAIFR